MSGLVADTHALVWLLVEPDKLSAAATTAFEQAVDNGDPIFLSAISMVELCYLIEKGRLSRTVLDRLIVPWRNRTQSYAQYLSPTTSPWRSAESQGPAFQICPIGSLRLRLARWVCR